MSSIRGKDTKPEMTIRRALHARGFRYGLHGTGLPGRPDLVLRKYRAVIFVHGCFWHGHDCPMFRLPRTRVDFWKAKIDRNRERDLEVMTAIREQGWRSLVIWECAMRGHERLPIEEVIERTGDWIVGSIPKMEIRGTSQIE